MNMGTTAQKNNTEIERLVRIIWLGLGLLTFGAKPIPRTGPGDDPALSSDTPTY